MGVSHKKRLGTVDGTPEKRLFLSIISDYDLKTGISELIDNALDLWLQGQRSAKLRIDVHLDSDRQFIRVRDNAGGVSESKARLLIAPGASGNALNHELIGIFGVGGKRAGVALGELVEIKTRFGSEKSIQIDLTGDWLASDEWEIEIFEIPDLDPGTTTVEISKVRQGFTQEDVNLLREHLAETYSKFLSGDCQIILNSEAIEPKKFDAWAYPKDFLPKTAKFRINPAEGGFIDVTLTAGLILDRIPEADNYGAYFYCNNRLIVKELKTRDVGYFIPSESGVPHPDASLCRVIVELNGSADLMPWNSSKSGLNFNHAALMQIRARIVDFCSYFSKVSRRLKRVWEDEVFPFYDGTPEKIDPAVALSNKRRVLVRLPAARKMPLLDRLRMANAKVLSESPWTLGLMESVVFVDSIEKMKLETKNRAALILLDSSIEIAFKEFIANNKLIFPPHKYNDKFLANLFQARTNVIAEVTAHVPIALTILNKINHYYNLRNKLVHERATVGILDSQVRDYREVVEVVLSSLFGLTFSV